MSGTIGKSLSLSSPFKVEEEAKQFTEKKQGIVSILGSDCGQTTKAASLRRTLSADMSSKKWLAQHEFSFSPMKKIASSKELSAVADSLSSSEGEEEDYEGKNELERPGQDDVWRSIQSQKKKLEKPGKFDTWGSILHSDHKAKEDDLSKLPPPYVHPLVKRSTSSLSEKSLEICTESLGSETGSDGYSSCAPSETGDVAEDHDNREEAQQSQQEKESQFFFDGDEFQVVKYNYSTSKKLLSPKSSFPPPLPSITPCDGEISLQVQSHRKNGRLVLEAVSLPSQNCFRARRQDGRLLLTFADNPPEEPLHAKMIDQEDEELVDEIEDDVFKNFEEEEGGGGKDYDSDAYEETEEEEEMVTEKIEKEEGAKEVGIVMEQAPMLSSGVINVHRSAIMMKKLLGLDNRNPTWTHKFKKAVNLEVEEEEEDATTQLPQSLPRMGRLIPSPPAPAAATSFNAYEYFWRTKPTVATLISPITQQSNTTTTTTTNKLILSNNSPKGYEQQEMVLLRGNKADYLVPLLRGCKEARRSLFFWEPYCIATS